MNSSLAWETDSWVPGTLETAFLIFLCKNFLACKAPHIAKNVMSGAFRNPFQRLCLPWRRFSVFALICFACSSDFCIVYWFVPMRCRLGVSQILGILKGGP